MTAFCTAFTSNGSPLPFFWCHNAWKKSPLKTFTCKFMTSSVTLHLEWKHPYIQSGRVPRIYSFSIVKSHPKGKAPLAPSFLSLLFHSSLCHCRALGPLPFSHKARSGYRRHCLPNWKILSTLYFFIRFYLRFPQFLGAWRVPQRGLYFWHEHLGPDALSDVTNGLR